MSLSDFIKAARGKDTKRVKKEFAGILKDIAKQPSPPGDPGYHDTAREWLKKHGADMPPFLSQDRPKKVKEIYSALKREHPSMPAEMKARISARQGRRGKQKQGPPYKAPITSKWKEKKSSATTRYDELPPLTGSAKERLPVQAGLIGGAMGGVC